MQTSLVAGIIYIVILLASQHVREIARWSNSVVINLKSHLSALESVRALWREVFCGFK
jgi:hypothetical protein